MDAALPTVSPLKLAGNVVFIAAWSASVLVIGGDARWIEGWFFAAWFIALSAWVIGWLYVKNPGLLVERMRTPGTGGQGGEDFFLVVLIALTFLAWMTAMPLGHRFGSRFMWAPRFPIAVRALGGALLLPAWFFLFRALKDNSFASGLVRIQNDRKQHVVSTGVYGFVRHPMYLGAVIMFVAAPLLLESIAGLVCAAVMTIVLAVRIVGEEKTLVHGLEGYERYRKTVRYRLVPWVWIFAVVLASSRARADEEPDALFSLRDGNILIDAGDKHEEMRVDCKETFALVDHGGRLFIACGAEGVAVYSIASGRPKFGGRIAQDEPCVVLARDGTCVFDKPDAPAVSISVTEPVVSQSDIARNARAEADAKSRASAFHSAGMGLVIFGGVAATTGTVVLVVQLFAAIGASVGSVACLGVEPCAQPSGPPAAVGVIGAALLLGGVGGLIAGAVLLSHSDKAAAQATAFVSPTGGGFRITF